MKITNSRTIIEVVGLVAILISLIFVAAELRQNNELMEAQDRFNRLNVSTEQALLVPANPDLATLFVKASTAEELSREETMIYEVYWDSAFRRFEWTYRELPREDFPLLRYKRYLQGPGVRKVWELYKNEYDSEFVAYMDQNVL